METKQSVQRQVFGNIAKSPDSFRCKCAIAGTGRQKEKEEREKKRGRQPALPVRICHIFIALLKTGTKVVINHSSVPHLSSPALLSFVRTLKHKEKNSEERCLMFRQNNCFPWPGYYMNVP